MSDTPRTKEEWLRLQRLPSGLYSPTVTTMDLAIGMTRLAEGLERECDGLRRAYDIALRQMNQAIAKAEWLRTDAIVDLERDKARLECTIKSERRCEFCREVPLTDKEREFISENTPPTRATD